MPSNLQVKDVSFAYGKKCLYHKINISLSQGQVLVICGSSGSGKTFLLEISAGLIFPLTGEILWDRVNIRKLSSTQMSNMRRKVGIVFQKHALLSNFSLYDNIALPLKYHGHPSERELRYIVDKQIDDFFLNGFQSLLPEEVSVSQRRLAALARALIMRPNLLFLDEPLQGLDPLTNQRVRQLILHQCRHQEITVVIVSNEKSFIDTLDCQIAYLKNGTLKVHSHPGEPGCKDELETFFEGKL